MRVLVVGASGHIGRHVTSSLVAAGHRVVCVLRREASAPFVARGDVEVRLGDVTAPGFWVTEGGRLEGFDAIVSALASRTGAPDDARRVDRDAHLTLFDAARRTKAHVVLISALCVQKPALPFQHAKLEAERALIASGLRHSIVRPTAFFKSLSGQVARVLRGEPYVVLGDGRLTACKPISARDLADFVVGCLTRPERFDRILPIGGPGPALTPREQGELLFDVCGRRPRFRHVPAVALDTVIGALSLAGIVSKKAFEKAELARIGRYYGTESMLVWDPVIGRYDATATPSWGLDTLREHFLARVRGEEADERREHAVF
jgi:divinyl chlorophyllide a 8-vinyl-reductase